MSGRPFSRAADTQRNLGKPANGGAAAAAPRKAMLNTAAAARELVFCATGEMLYPAVFSMPKEAEAVPRFTASVPLSTKASDVVSLPLCAQHTQTKWRPCRTVLQCVMNNAYMSISAPQESTRSLASPPGHTLFRCPPACTPWHWMESLHALGQKVSCRIRGIQHLSTLHEESSAPACAGGSGQGCPGAPCTVAQGISVDVGLSCTCIPCHACTLFQRVQGESL